MRRKKKEKTKHIICRLCGGEARIPESRRFDNCNACHKRGGPPRMEGITMPDFAGRLE